MICNDYVVGKASGGLFDANEEPKHTRLITRGKLAGVEFREDVMNIKNYWRAAKFRKQSTKNQQIWNGMYMKQVIMSP